MCKVQIVKLIVKVQTVWRKTEVIWWLTRFYFEYFLNSELYTLYWSEIPLNHSDWYFWPECFNILKKELKGFLKVCMRKSAHDDWWVHSLLNTCKNLYTHACRFQTTTLHVTGHSTCWEGLLKESQAFLDKRVPKKCKFI